MGSYPDRYQKDDFETFVSILHRPTETKFYQQAGRVIVLKLNPDTGLYHSFADFTTTELQIEGTYLTEAALRRAAITWLKGHLK
jgi:hypothetical protein